ncbi:beta-ketoacyl-ACP synthase 3 [Streptomyces hesseae]|uniref:Beta-ketoacyl-[acyl-carrier-protein] synthase III n=1 Tax=Streptomyces hesseae TaxID=3075519 RepID=A0ABU2SFV2_9ACTN|nr:beta-ketoacyl-ACP synthase 3 [Streptomyces sp. DSM 40473]MDT0447835.1 beta-ketoacyl-ACP synthase 3 [Streptomyces sp. DSM 40473]
MRLDDTTAAIVGVGSCLPDRVLDNHEIIERGALNTTDEWIRRRTGIARRRYVTLGTSTGDLAVGAGRAAMASAGTCPDFVLLATTTPDHPCPATAPAVAYRLGLDEVPAFDLGAVCSGFVYALAVATALVKAGTCATPLVIGAETYSSIIDPRDRGTAPLFGDGAGAVVLRAGPPDAPGALRALDLGSDGSGERLIVVPDGGSRRPRGPLRAIGPGDHCFRMQGRAVYGQAVRRMTASARRVLCEAGWEAPTVRAFVGHQANQRILDSVAERLGIAAGNRYGNLHEVGNTAAASVPLALADGLARSSLQPGSRALLTAFGGGLTWASAALTWPAAQPRAETIAPSDPLPTGRSRP